MPTPTVQDTIEKAKTAVANHAKAVAASKAVAAQIASETSSAPPQ